MIATTRDEKDILGEAGRRLARIVSEIGRAVHPGLATSDLEALARRLIEEGGDIPSFLGHQPEWAEGPYPSALCVSVNDEVVHGIPGKRVLCEGDIVGLDLGIKHDGLFVDMAVTVPVGKISQEDAALIEDTRESLARGIQAAREGATVGDIGNAIESFLKPRGYGIIRDLGGHGVGRAVHEEPFIPNFGVPGEGSRLTAGMVIAIEPMVSRRGEGVVTASDGYTVRTKDGSTCAHFEHTIMISGDAPIILTSFQ